MTIGALLLILLGLLMIRKLRLSQSTTQLLPVLDTAGKSPLVKNIKTITNQGGRVDWSPTGDLIAFDRMGEDGYYDVWLMKPDGIEQRCLTCGKPGVPQKHNGQPAWHPTGQYVVFQSQDPNLKGLPSIFARAERVLTGPGAGINNNLWLMSSDGNRFWQLTSIEEKMGVLHPHFSHDGKKLLWSERVSNEPKPGGQWMIKVAEFSIIGDQPRLENIQELQPGNLLFYETHGFSPDDKTILFSATKTGQYADLDIYTYSLATVDLKILTDPNLYQWDEHAHFSPDGTKIIWMSSMEIEQQIKNNQVITDYWMMNTDGTQKGRLTYFNQPNAPEYSDTSVTAADLSFSPDGKKIVAYLIIEIEKGGLNILIELVE